MPALNTSARPHAQADQPISDERNRALRQKRFKARQAWIDDLHRRPKVTLCEKLVGTRLALHQNLATGACFPSVTTLSAETGIPERSVYRALDGLKCHGRIGVQSGGRGRANHYFLIPPTPDKASGVPLTQRHLTPCQPNYEAPPEGLRPSSGEQGERALPPSSEARPSPTPAAVIPPGMFEASAEGAGQELPEIPSETPIAGEEKIDAKKIDAAWHELHDEVWRRPWPETPQEVSITRCLFGKLVREGADAEAIIASARAWVTAFAEKPDMLKPLWKWLHGWEIPPPAKRKRQTPATSGCRGKPQRMTRGRAGVNYYDEVVADRNRQQSLSHDWSLSHG